MFSLTGKKALVTGSSRGIGRGIALALATQGADVAINYTNNLDSAQEVAQEIEDLHQEALVIQADVSSSKEVEKMFAEINKKWGKLDILVNNAGIIRYNDFEKVSESEWDEIIGVNLKGQFLCAQRAVKLMKHGGRIINIASISSGGVGVAFPQIVPYTASKGGVVGMTENLAVDLGPKNINVNAIAPGVIETDMSKTSLKNKAEVEALLSRIPKRRAGKPSDIGAAAAFLASDEADYITGNVLYVDGGWLAD